MIYPLHGIRRDQNIAILQMNLKQLLWLKECRLGSTWYRTPCRRNSRKQELIDVQRESAQRWGRGRERSREGRRMQRGTRPLLGRQTRSLYWVWWRVHRYTPMPDLAKFCFKYAYLTVNKNNVCVFLTILLRNAIDLLKIILPKD